MSEIEKIRECSSAFDEALKVGDGDKCASFYIPDGVKTLYRSRAGFVCERRYLEN
jgi:ketosteroid isomerase-like protein